MSIVVDVVKGVIEVGLVIEDAEECLELLLSIG
jgi:hypothetical protein